MSVSQLLSSVTSPALFIGTDSLVSHTPLASAAKQTVVSLPQATGISANLATTDFAVFSGAKASPLQTSGSLLKSNISDWISSDFSASTYLKVKGYSPEFRTQAAASQYIASQMNGTFHYPLIDQKMRDAVEEACNAWKPGMDLAKMVYDKVRAALTGVLPETPSSSGTAPRFDYPQTPDAVARQAAAQITANGNTVAGVAEHMYWTPIQKP